VIEDRVAAVASSHWQSSIDKSDAALPASTAASCVRERERERDREREKV